MTQPTVHLSEDGSIPDETYHCAEPLRMRLSELDPSVALVSEEEGLCRGRGRGRIRGRIRGKEGED